ncbi:Sensor histidine kinase YehU [compost metagenome]
MPLLKEEIDLVRHYLQIYALRLERLDYQIDVPPNMLDARVMRLIVQPVVENAVMHGIEPKPGRGSVWISGRRESGWNILQIEDSGMGMTEESITAYMRRLEQPMDERTGCGLWNIHQRLKQRFGLGAGIYIEPSKRLSGLCVRLSWKAEENDGEGRSSYDTAFIGR